MVDKLEVGLKLSAKYIDGEFYPAEVLVLSESKKRAKTPVKVHFSGYGEEDDTWLAVEDLKSKRLPKPSGKAKAKAKAKAKPEMDYSGLEKGMRVQAEADGIYYAAEVVTVSEAKNRSKAPVKVHFMGYTAASDEWVGADRLRSKALKPKSEAGDKPKRVPGKTMPPAAKKYLLQKPKVTPPLDSDYCPLVLGKRKYLEAAKDCTDKLTWGLVRQDGCGRYSLPVFPEKSKDAMASTYLAGKLIQEMLWQRGAAQLLLHGPPRICKALKAAYSKGGAFEFEISTMPHVSGTPETPFEVKIVSSLDEIPENKDSHQECGKDTAGCRLAFDLGKSDIKTVAVKDGEVLYSKETEWDVTNADPQYHFDAVLAALKEAASKLPKVEAIGGSATGTIGAKNEATWCDLFPNVPPDVYKEKVVDIFDRLAKELAPDAPLKVINDGEVTALAAVQKIGSGKVIGISMGSDEGAGYATGDGNLLGWINEFGYMPLDLSPKAATNPWDKHVHTGCAHMYLGQRGATKLAAKGGVDLPDNYKYPHADMTCIKHEDHAQCLKLIQKAMTDSEKEPTVREIYVTIGVYLGYALAQYSEFYPIDHVLILGRVSKGKGGDIMLDTAKKVLEEEFPEYKHIQFHTADDHFKAVGQCIAAAALPPIKK
mmetsp:Transcript_40654/g.91727  ORF Transcript_40654/g.91727 Transcript_40654/m.91727 type:complete len:652 (+) Transcript_40654:87-2042(+)|eukprot:CAMPEP_0197890014 /NCGR_PEP_ID=MMETSP1439-20131203/25155_1 /TAXON_ID=66791 /ORGANISM="Gonyaulax spinifera, Strain CCMP409" /LENGTH=651 /DNA_ID=CAMNT_0043510017 /DNA_START=87 /DNA_END=2042 /DNA_ORIENTATION=-